MGLCGNFTPVPSWFVKQVVPSLIFHLLLMTSNELILCSSEFTPNWTTNMWGLFWPDSLMVMVTPLKGTNFGGSRKSPIPVLLNLGGPVSLFSSNSDTKERFRLVYGYLPRYGWRLALENSSSNLSSLSPNSPIINL